MDIIQEQIAGIPFRVSIYAADERMANDMHRFSLPNQPYRWLVIAEPYADMDADQFFGSGWAVRIFEGVWWRGYTNEESERQMLLAQIHQRIEADVPGYLDAAARRAMDDLLTAMRDYAAMVIDLERRSGLDAFFTALAEFASQSATCTGCGYEVHESQMCDDCGRCAACCTCGGGDDKNEPVCPDCGQPDCCCKWYGPYWAFDNRKARRLAAARELA